MITNIVSNTKTDITGKVVRNKKVSAVIERIRKGKK